MTDEEKTNQRFVSVEDGLIIEGNNYVPNWDNILKKVNKDG